LLPVFILCITDTDDVALLELQVAVLLILHPVGHAMKAQKTATKTRVFSTEAQM